MIKDQEEKEASFKVVDRRRFDEEGREKASCDHDHHDNHTHDIKAPHAKTDTNSSERQSLPMTFSLFIQTLAHQAMMGLGLVPWPDTNLVRKDASLAKETIDLLIMLKEKTANNLSVEEQALIDGMIYQLQIAYVELIK